VNYTYLPDGKVDHEDYANGVRSDLAYNGRGFIILTRTYRQSSPQQTYSKRDYWRDERDRITAWQKGSDGSANPMENGRGDRYEYDEEGQLTRASYQAVDPNGNTNGAQRADLFYYDELGSRVDWNTVASRGAVNFSRRNNGLNQYAAWENGYPNHWGSGIFHDDNLPAPSPAPSPPWAWVAPGNGVTMQDGYITASFNALNQPVAMWSPALGPSTFMWFGYDPLGRCVKRWIGPVTAGTAGYNPATYFYYDGWNLVQEGPNASVADRTYVHGNRVDEIVASQVSGAWYYHHYDARGHCIMLTNTSGGLQEQYDYDAFGYPRFYTATGMRLGTFHTRFLFTGREWLDDLRIYDFRARQYQPELGRFLQPDPQEFAAGDYNLYRYCHNDPVNKSDPLGFDWRIDPRMNEKYKERTLSQIDRARKLDRRIDQKFKDMEANHKVMNTFTDAQTPENRRGTRLPDGTRGNSTAPASENGKDATIYYSPDNWRVLSGYRDPVIGLVHELPHAERVNDGTFSTNALFGGTEQEIESIRFENIARALIDGSRRPENPFRNDVTYP
jgi:RHS repeat-associated protein